MALVADVNVSRTSGVAPLAVVFDASPTSYGALNTFNECRYEWDFGLSTPGFVNRPDVDATLGHGPVQARIFNETTNVTLLVTAPDGTTDTWSQTITVTPEASHTWAHTYYFDPILGNDLGLGTQASPFQTWTKCLTVADNDVLCILNPGEYTDYGSGSNVTNITGVYQVRAADPNNKPVIQKSATSSLVTFSAVTDCRFIDLDLHGNGAVSGNGHCVLGFSDYQLFLRCNFTLWNSAIQKGTTTPTTDGLVIADCTFSNNYGYAIYDDIITQVASGGPGRYHRYCAMLANTITDSQSQPLTRIFWQQSCVLYNTFGTCFAGNNQFRWQGRNGAPEVAQYCYVARNTFANAGTLSEVLIQLASAANTDIGLMQYVLIERNLCTQNSGTDKRFIEIRGQVTSLAVRHNIVIGAGRFLFMNARHNSAASGLFELFNNVHYHNHASSNSRLLIDQDGDANSAIGVLVMRNNVISLPSTTGGRVMRFNGAQVTATITSTNNCVYTPSIAGGDAAILFNCDFDDDGIAEAVSWTTWTTTHGKDANSIRVDPEFTDVAGNDFTPADGSPLIDTGFDLSAVVADTDYVGDSPPVDGDEAGGAQWDIGAIELVPPADPLDPVPAIHRLTTCVIGNFGAADVGTVIANAGDELPAAYEPSGATWHSELSKLFTVHDGGRISYMDADGAHLVNVPAAGNFANPPDFEGICVAHPESDFVYAACERNDPGLPDNTNTIKEINYLTEAVIRTFTLDGVSGFTTPAVNSGIEGITFVPNAFLATPSTTETGLFFVGVQETAVIHRFELTIDSSTSATTVTHKGSFASGFATEVAGLDFDPTEGILWAISDADGKIRALEPDGTLIAEWTAPTDSGAQEGIAVNGTTLFIADDGGNIRSYDFTRGGTISVRTGTYDDGDTANLRTSPLPGWRVFSWSGTANDASTKNNNTVLMDADKVVTVQFVQEESGLEGMVPRIPRINMLPRIRRRKRW